VYEGKEDVKCKVCGKLPDEHHGTGRYCSKRCSEAIAKLLKTLTPQLYGACRTGDDKAILRLVTAGADINIEDAQGRSPLHCACRWGKASVVSSLISSRANVSAREKGRDGYSALQFGCEGGSAEVVRLLLAAGASATQAYGESRSTSLHLACKKRAHAICELLLEHGADANAKDVGNSTPLHEAVGSNEAKSLIRNKADVMARDSNLRTPLHKAAFAGNRSVCLLLLESNAQVNAGDAEGSFTNVGLVLGTSLLLELLCVCICICICVCVCVCVCARACVCIYIHIYIHICMYIYIFI